MDHIEVIETLGDYLAGDHGASLQASGWDFVALDVGELWVRNLAGDVFRLTAEAIPADFAATCGIDFDV
jgi:hypothetical protein